jgi:hypothetical protein
MGTRGAYEIFLSGQATRTLWCSTKLFHEINCSHPSFVDGFFSATMGRGECICDVLREISETFLRDPLRELVRNSQPLSPQMQLGLLPLACHTLQRVCRWV